MSRSSSAIVRFDTKNVVYHEMPQQHSRLTKDDATNYWYTRDEIDTIEKECRRELTSIMSRSVSSKDVNTSSSKSSSASSRGSSFVEFFSSLRGMEPPKDAKKAKQVMRSVIHSQNCIDCITYKDFVKECTKRAISLAYLDEISIQDYVSTTYDELSTERSEERSPLMKRSKSVPTKILKFLEVTDKKATGTSISVVEPRRRPHSFTQRSKCKNRRSQVSPSPSSSSSSSQPRVSFNKKLSLRMKKQKKKCLSTLRKATSSRGRLSQ